MSETLLAITPIDGRYKKSVSELNEIFSEYGMIRRRVDVEIEYFINYPEKISQPLIIPIARLKTSSSMNYP